MDYKLILHKETLGVTKRALKALRDELAERIQHEISVFQVPSADGVHCQCYGFFLVDKSARQIIIIGDGFRGDGGGEGGAGARAALALLAIYHLVPLEMAPEEDIQYREDVSSYQAMANKVLEIVEASKFDIARDNIPSYIDWCFSHLGR